MSSRLRSGLVRYAGIKQSLKVKRCLSPSANCAKSDSVTERRCKLVCGHSNWQPLIGLPFSLKRLLVLLHAGQMYCDLWQSRMLSLPPV